MGSIIAITNQELFKLLKVRLGGDGIVTLKCGELLDSIIQNDMGSTCYLRKVKGFEEICHFLILMDMTLQINDGYLRGIGTLNLQGFYKKSIYLISFYKPFQAHG